MTEELLRLVHVLGAAVLFGTGAGIAFFMVMAHRSGDVRHIAHVARTVVIADFVFTASAVVLQPLTGIWLAAETGWPLTTPWIMLSLGLYVFTGLCWLPVVWIQMQLRDMAHTAVIDNAGLPERYARLYRIWFALGFPAFFAVIGIFWLMLIRPALWS